jgi:putative tricarboxylic transport membrane protein
MNNIIAGLILIGLSIFFFYLTTQFPIVKGYQQMGDAFWPRAVLFVLIGLSVILIVQSFLKGRKKETAKKTSLKAVLDRPALFKTMGVMIVYILCIPYLGFLVSTFLSLIVFSYLMGDRSTPKMVYFSLGMTVATYLVFALLIYTALPRGVWIFKSLSNLLY